MRDIDASLDILCDPHDRSPLSLCLENTSGYCALVNATCQRRYEIQKGIPNFSPSELLTGFNLKYQKMYNRMAPVYDMPTRIMNTFFKTTLDKMESESLQDIKVKPGNRVLEVSIGTGGNFRTLPEDISVFGIDISMGMLGQAQRNFRNWGRKACLFQGEAENLPFKDCSFDVVFHVGGINFFNNKRKAIEEMARVTKPGTKVVIIDEMEIYIKNIYEKIPYFGRYFQNRSDTVTPPEKLVPAGMKDVLLKNLWDGKMYCLSFVKP
ncbi:MAG: methyltransferase domain-containing protein [Elusimicrobiales bacterium]|nr:methyltransferase domain-containing protein [Elusimicrobiales bacterium]